jgi:hypothetical protein
MEPVKNFIAHQKDELKMIHEKSRQKRAQEHSHASFLFLFVEALAKSCESNLHTQESLANTVNDASQQMDKLSEAQQALAKKGSALSADSGASSEEINKEALSIQVEQSSLSAKKAVASQNQNAATFNIGNLGTEQGVLTAIGNKMVAFDLSASNNVKRAK